MSEWRWIRTYYEAGGCLTFARGATPGHVIEAFELDPARAVLVPEEQVDQTLRYPLFDRESDGLVVGPWIRAGRFGEWAFAIEPFPTDVDGEAGRRLSFFWGEAVVVLWTPTVNTARYFAGGEEMTVFQPEMACYRYGRDPDRFVAQMRQAGLDLEEFPAEEDEAEESAVSEREQRYINTDHVLAALDMFTLALGIRLPADVAAGPLLTVQRMPPGLDS